MAVYDTSLNYTAWTIPTSSIVSGELYAGTATNVTYSPWVTSGTVDKYIYNPVQYTNSYRVSATTANSLTDLEITAEQTGTGTNYNLVYSPTNISNYVTVDYAGLINSSGYISGDGLAYYGGYSKRDMERARFKHNLAILVRSRPSALGAYPAESEPERRALETLREVISETEFRKYLRYGFVLVRGKSGATYQVFRNQSHCKVWLNGKLIEEICVRIKNEQVPKTDKVIAFKAIIEASEEEFKKLGNVYKMAA